MSVVDRIHVLALQLEGLGSGIHASVRALPSGVLFLNAYVDNRDFVIEYSPSECGFGVDEVQEWDLFAWGYNHWFTEFQPAADKLTELVQSARTPVATNGARMRRRSSTVTKVAAAKSAKSTSAD